MDDAYYRDLVDKVELNQRRMFSGGDDSEKDFEDFSKLWEILFDEDPAISGKTFFDAVDLCLNSYYGASQNHTIVWESILNRYKSSLNNSVLYDDFKNAFIEFSNMNSGNAPVSPDAFGIFSEMINMAIDKSDKEMVSAIIDLVCCEELWYDEDDISPEWGVWFAIFLDKDFSEVKKCPETIEALNHIKEKFNDQIILEHAENLAEFLNI
ncbi:MAG: hypothetical protein K2G90_03975 [Muribaculaceae bacterium]|nr:hypothetical protein [Muribaculaceae bacterium]